MKKLIIILLTLCCFTFCFMLSGCNVSDSPETSVPSSIAGSATEESTSVPQTETDNSLEAADGAGNNETRPQDATSVSDSAEIGKNSDAEESTRVPEGTSESKVPQTSETKSRPTESATETKPKESDPPRVTTETTTPPQTESETKENVTPSEAEIIQEPKAGASDTRAVARKVLEYVNEFRNSPAVNLTGLTSYAEYRSRQIVSNFAHDTADQRAAATALQYGEYVDPSVFGGSGQPYYRANAREAIAKAGYVGTIDEVALKLATLVKNSPNHWNYIGSSEYSYIAVGVTYESGMWYCAITVASENTDEY